VEIARGDLAEILHSATQDEVEHVFADSITGITQGHNGIDVSFERSKPRRFDLAVGADGRHSGVRQLAFGDESQFIRHFGLYMSIFTADNHLGLDRWQLAHSQPGRTATISSIRNSDKARAILFFASPPLDYDHRDIEAQRRILAAKFAGVGWEVPRLLEAMLSAPDFYFDSTCQVRMDNWSTGRVALIGDAAYGASPLSGQGTSLALVGAYVLADELAAAKGDHSTAFAHYQQRMREFVERNQRLGERNANRMAPASRRQIWLQRTSVRLLPYLPGKNLMLKLATKGVTEAANAVDLDPRDRAVDREHLPRTVV
jgi:2-polyprenyl-6-methoxyphenol hydroxylase-like FAD-dependent oxidoreductase